MDTEYTELALAELGTPNPVDTVDLAGNELISAPGVNFNFAVDYEKLLSDNVVARVNLDGNYQGKQWYSAYNDFVSPVNPAIDYGPIQQDAYWVFNGRLTFANVNDTLALSFWGKNLFDEAYDVYSISCPIPDDHIAPSRSALFLARSVLKGIRNGGYDANQVA